MTTVYLLHFSEAYRHARHYIGYTAGDLAERLERHRSGRGANLVRVAIAAGRRVTLARAWHGAPRKFELRLKAMGGAGQLCPYCSGVVAFRRGRLPD